MKKIALAALVLAMAFAGSAFAFDLTGNVTSDDAFKLWVGTNPLAAPAGYPDGQLSSGNAWWTPMTFNTVLTPYVTNYIMVEAWDLHKVISGFLGDFTLTNSNFKFDNNTNSLLSNLVNWTVHEGGWNGALKPTDASTALGGTGFNDGTGPWGPAYATKPAGPISGISTEAQWIWSNAGTGSLTQTDGQKGPSVFFTAKINPTVTPEPFSAALFLIGGVALSTRKLFKRKK